MRNAISSRYALRRLCGVPSIFTITSPRQMHDAHRIITSAQRWCSSSTPPSVGTHHPGGLFDLTTLLHDEEAASSSSSSSSLSVPTHEVRVRGRVERIRKRGGKLTFLHLRQPPQHTSIQVVCSGALAATAARSITPESVVIFTGTLHTTTQPITSTRCAWVEMHATSLEVMSTAATPLPFPLADRQTKLDTRLDHRVMDLRTTFMAAMVELRSCITQRLREELLALRFVEIHTPKLISASSEGAGSAVFAVKYFGHDACLAQSPQLYKQMMIMGDVPRVFEIAPVFRAEKSLTHRHLTEFVGVDGEMVVERDYVEVMDVLEHIMCGMIARIQQNEDESNNNNGKKSRVQRLLDVVRAELAHDGGEAPSPIVAELSEEVIARFGISTDIDAATVEKNNNNNNNNNNIDAYGARVGRGLTPTSPRVLRLTFDSAVALLRAEGGGATMTEEMEDLTLPDERRLGHLVKQRYGVDVFMMDQFPLSSRPFYTMPSGDDDGDDVRQQQRRRRCRGFDLFLRGEEICSGAQRLASRTMLEERMRELNLEPSSVADYLRAFEYGAWPHGGFGLGLDRIVQFLVGAPDIRNVSMFPRDPKRLRP